MKTHSMLPMLAITLLLLPMAASTTPVDVGAVALPPPITLPPKPSIMQAPLPNPDFQTALLTFFGVKLDAPTK